MNIPVDKKYHSAFCVAFPEINIQIRTCDYALCLSGEFNDIAAVESFFDSLSCIYESFFILSVEDPNPEDADLYEGTATIDTYRWRFHLSAEDDPWPFRLHGHHGNQVLDIRTGDVYTFTARHWLLLFVIFLKLGKNINQVLPKSKTKVADFTHAYFI